MMAGSFLTESDARAADSISATAEEFYAMCRPEPSRAELEALVHWLAWQAGVCRRLAQRAVIDGNWPAAVKQKHDCRALIEAARTIQNHHVKNEP